MEMTTETIITKLKIGLLVALALSFTSALIAQPASAKKCGNTETAILECDNTENSIALLLKQAVQILYAVIGVLSVVMVMVAGLIYATAGEHEERVKLAKTMIRNTIIGIVLYMFMTVILNFLVPGGVF